MTIQQAIQALIAWCLAQVGYAEGANNFNKYADSPDLRRWYGWNAQHQPWCDIFADSAFLAVFGLIKAAKMTYQAIGSGSALCRASADFYKRAGAWYTSPQPGDQVFFFYDGAINHTGIVTSVSGGIVYTVEGNSGDAVRRCAYAIGSPVIAGYGRPDWAVVAGDDSVDVPAVESDPVETGRPVLRRGDIGADVVELQQALINRGYSCGVYGADGEYGPDTWSAVIAFQRDKGLEQDGVVGPATWAALEEDADTVPASTPSQPASLPEELSTSDDTTNRPMLRYGDVGEAVVELQQALVAAGFDVGTYGVDGEFGRDTECAVVAYQTVHNLEIDGIVGPETWGHLLGGV